MEGNKDESERCISLGLKYLQIGNTDKALKFFIKGEKLYPSRRAKDLINQIIASSASAASGEEVPSPSEASASNGSADGTENLRHRRTNSSAGAEMHKEYTTDQLEAVRKLRKCKDYYEILGVTKDCSEDDVKRAYKKLALKYHPDKNKAPGATEAFKAIGNAFAVLNDSEKKRRYDELGCEAERVPNHRHSHGYYEYDYSRGFEGDISAEELFNMFFGGGFNTGHVHTRRMYRTRSTYNDRDRNESQFAYMMQIIPVIFLVFISVLSAFLARENAFSFHRTQKYHVERTTQNLHIPYYVKHDFSTEYRGSIKQLEQQVEEEYISNLRSNCYRERSYKESMLWRARNFGDRSLYQKAQDMKTPSCENLQRLYGGG
ncbi:hypothetical protein LSH36_317g03065 [Paralvinella palmiformis]|uniref:J domain-containing protein n=1 Tax=Paralvinella palmiformis TaxID=53620 RepID=A0AAD9JHK7_9ANNE|nr:hypothetical protein LSH36_317g03065 [Paralvinella palmiformis]